MEQKQEIEILKAIADETRLSIVRKLASSEEPVTSCDIVTSCQQLDNLSQPAASHHFSKLVNAGVISERKQGTQKVYQLRRDTLKSIGVDASTL